MNKPKQMQTSKDESLTFEAVRGKDNVVKVISHLNGIKHEVFVYVMSEEEFEDLLPDSEKVAPHMKLAAG